MKFFEGSKDRAGTISIVDAFGVGRALFLKINDGTSWNPALNGLRHAGGDETGSSQLMGDWFPCRGGQKCYLQIKILFSPLHKKQLTHSLFPPPPLSLFLSRVAVFNHSALSQPRSFPVVLRII